MGAAETGKALIYDKSRILDQGKGRFLFASSQPLQEAFEKKEKGCSIFTYYLVRGLKGNEGSVDIDGNITPSSLGNYVYDALMNLPAEKRPKQKPIMKMAAAADIILAYYPQLARRKLEITPELTNVASLINEGNEYFVFGEYEEAIKRYSDALYIDPTSPILWIKKGLALSNLGKYEEALYSYQRALDLDPTNVRAIKFQHNLLLKFSGRTAIQKNMDLTELKKYYKNNHAVIIGISKYKEEDQLPNAYNDARTIMTVLKEKYGFDNIISLFNEDATYKNIRGIFVDLFGDPDKIGPNDRVLLYYSGHGKLRRIVGYEGEDIKKGYVIPCDAQKNKYSSYLEMEAMVDGCQNCQAKHILLILDCCYSGYLAMRDGGLNKPEKITDRYLENIAANRAIQVMAAGQEEQSVNDSGFRPGHSAFTGALLDMLEVGRDLDNNGILTASEIGSKLACEVARHVKGTPQTPVFNNLSVSRSGDFIFRIFGV
jgi:tetratricopeptide (TPR) repeat protein